MGTAPYFGRAKVPGFAQLITLYPRSIADVAIIFSTATMTIVAAYVEYRGSKTTSKNVDQNFRNAIRYSIALLSILLVLYFVTVTQVPDLGSYVTGFTGSSDVRCKGMSSAECIYNVTHDNEVFIDLVFGELQIRLAKTLLVITYAGFMSIFAYLIALIVLSKPQASPQVQPSHSRPKLPEDNNIISSSSMDNLPPYQIARDRHGASPRPQVADRMGTNMPIRNKIFVSYSHKDMRLFEEFKTMLAPAIQRGLVDLWDDQKIPPGAMWKKEIQNALASASVAVLLVSQNFLASHFIEENELPPLLKASREEGVIVFWIYLSSCLFEQTEIASYQAAHDISRPLDRLPKSQRQAVLSQTCTKLIQAATSAAPSLEPTRTAPRTPVSSSGPTTRQAPGALPADQRTVVSDMLEKCYRRALFTRMHAQMNLDAMFNSIDDCRVVVQQSIPKISNPDLQQTAIDLMAVLGGIVKRRANPDANHINNLKLQALHAFQILAAATGSRYALPKPGRLGETVYFTQEEADYPPSLKDLQLEGPSHP